MYGKSMQHRRQSTERYRKEHIHRNRWNFTPSTPLPKERHLHLRTAETFLISATSGALGQYPIQVSSAAALSSTPPGDLWGYFYQHYVVLGAKVTINYGFTNATAASTVVCGTYFSPTSPNTGGVTGYTQYEEFIDAGRGTYEYVTASAAAGPHKLVPTYSCKKAYQTNIMDDQENLGAQIGYSAPNSIWHAPTGLDAYAQIIFWVQSVDKSSTTSLDLSIVIDWSIMVNLPIDLPV